jgi:hypothetical protein
VIGEVTLVCDSPWHARGKIATLAVYVRVSGRWEQQQQSPWRKTALRTRRAQDQRQRARPSSYPRSSDQPQCKLCGATLVGYPNPAQFELERFAMQDQRRISVRDLNKLRLRESGSRLPP